MLVRPAYNHKRKYLQAPLAEIGDAESYTIFDNVFVPRERVFLDGKCDPTLSLNVQCLVASNIFQLHKM